MHRHTAQNDDSFEFLTFVSGSLDFSLMVPLMEDKPKQREDRKHNLSHLLSFITIETKQQSTVGSGRQYTWFNDLDLTIQARGSSSRGRQRGIQWRGRGQGMDVRESICEIHIICKFLSHCIHFRDYLYFLKLKGQNLLSICTCYRSWLKQATFTNIITIHVNSSLSQSSGSSTSNKFFLI